MLEALLEEARLDENVVGVLLFGSRAREAYVHGRSDWDVYVVVREGRVDRPFRRGEPIETIELTLDELADPTDGLRYHLAWIEPQLDKTGEVAEALRKAVHVDPGSADQPLSTPT